jgi:hypothetical protein
VRGAAHGTILHITNSLSLTNQKQQPKEKNTDSIIQEHKKVYILYRFSNIYGGRTHSHILPAAAAFL